MSENPEPQAEAEGGTTAAAAASDKKEEATTPQSDTPDSEEGDDKKTEPANPASEDKAEAEKEVAAAENKQKKETPSKPADSAKGTPIVSSSKKSRPPYKYDPEKITLRFLFANRDGLTVTVECTPSDTVGEVKGALLSVWPEDLPNCSGGDKLRLICMGKGVLMPDTRTLEDCQVPVFKTHPTPINVSIRPEISTVETSKSSGDGNKRAAAGGGNPSSGEGEQTSQGCACVIL